MHNKLFIKYIRLYLGVFLALIILLIPIYSSIYQSTRERVVGETYNQIEQGAADLDNYISKMSTFTKYLRNEKHIIQLMQIEGLPENKDVNSMLEAKKSIVNGMILENERAYMIFKNNDIVLTKGPILSDPRYHEYDDYGISNVSYPEFKKLIFDNKNAMNYIAQDEMRYGDRFCCIIKESGNYGLGYDMAMCFEISKEKIYDFLNVTENKQFDFLYITDSSYNVLYGENLPSNLPKKNKISENGITSLQNNGTDYTLMGLKGETCGLQIFVGLSQNRIMQDIYRINHIMFLYFLLAVLCMFAFCIVFAIQRAARLKIVLGSLKKDENAISEVRNEYKYIVNQINGLWSDNESYRVKIDNLQQLIGNSMMEKLLFRGVYSLQEQEEIQTYLNWDMEYYCVLCIGIWMDQEVEEYEMFLQDDDYLLQEFTKYSIITGKNEKVYIVKMQEEDMPNADFIIEKLQPFMDRNSLICVGISSIGVGLENIHLCYQQARIARRQILGDYSKRVCVYQRRMETKDKIFRLNLDNRIYDLILAEDRAALHALFDKIRHYASRSVWNSEYEIIQFFFEIQNPIARVWDETENKEQEIEFPEYQADKSLQELISELEKICEYLCQCIYDKKEESKRNIYNHIVNFVKEHACEKEMCVSYVAGQFGISEKHFTSIFKEQTGKNFVSFVEMNRMKMAEKYLLETDWSIGRIAKEIGYNTIDAFYKSFKKIYGVAPGKWKESRGNYKEKKNL